MVQTPAKDFNETFDRLPANDNMIATEGSDFAVAKHNWFLKRFGYFVNVMVVNMDNHKIFGETIGVWLNEHIKFDFELVFTSQGSGLKIYFYFSNAQDALLFKLTWGDTYV